MPNAIAPTIQVTAINLAYLAGGIVVVEFVFAYPGIGAALVDARREPRHPDRPGCRFAHRRRLRRAQPHRRRCHDPRQPSRANSTPMTTATAPAGPALVAPKQRRPWAGSSSARGGRRGRRSGALSSSARRLRCDRAAVRALRSGRVRGGPVRGAFRGRAASAPTTSAATFSAAFSGAAAPSSRWRSSPRSSASVSESRSVSWRRTRAASSTTCSCAPWTSSSPSRRSSSLSSLWRPWAPSCGCSYSWSGSRPHRASPESFAARPSTWSSGTSYAPPRASAVSRSKILFGEVLPNITSPLVVEASLRLTFSIALISALSFLGFGLQPPAADWGLMINENRLGLEIQPWGVVAPRDRHRPPHDRHEPDRRRVLPRRDRDPARRRASDDAGPGARRSSASASSVDGSAGSTSSTRSRSRSPPARCSGSWASPARARQRSVLRSWATRGEGRGSPAGGSSSRARTS